MREQHRLPAALGAPYLWLLFLFSCCSAPTICLFTLIYCPFHRAPATASTGDMKCKHTSTRNGDAFAKFCMNKWISQRKEQGRQSVSLRLTSVCTNPAVKALGSCSQICSFCSNPRALDATNSSSFGSRLLQVHRWVTNGSLTKSKELDKYTSKHT